MRLCGPALAALLLAAPAFAQAPEAAGRRPAPQSPPRPDYDPPGVRLGAFRIDGAAEAGMGHDSNPVPNAPGRAPSGFAEEALRLSARSQWSRHEVTGAASFAARQYFTRPELDTQRIGALLAGRADVGARGAIGLSYRHARSYLDPFDIDVQAQGVAVPIPFETDVLRLDGRTGFNRLSLAGGLEYQRLRYGEARDTTGMLRSFAADDYDLLGADIEAAWELRRARSLTARLRLAEISYRDPASSGRDGRSWEVLLGANHEFSPLLLGRVALGYLERRYESAALAPLSGFAFDAELLYSPTRRLALTLGARRSIQESIRTDAVGYVRTTARVAADVEVWRNLALAGELRAELRDYGQAGGTGTDGVAQVEGRLLVNRHATLVATLRYTERFEAPLNLGEYEQVLAALRLRLAY